MIYDSRQQNVTEIERKMWTLFDPNRETISDELSMEEAQLAIESLKSRYLNRYLIWNSEWAKWKLLNEFLRSPECPFSDYSNNLNFSRDINFEVEKIGKPAMKLVEPRKALRIQSTVSEMNTNIVELKNLVFKSKRQFDGDDLVMENLNSSLDLNFSSLSISSSFRKMNLTDKYKIQLLLIHNQGQTFRTAAKDISISGTYAERIVPQEFHSGSTTRVEGDLAGLGRPRRDAGVARRRYVPVGQRAHGLASSLPLSRPDARRRRHQR